MNNGSVTALLFEAAGQRYGLDVSDVVEVVPAVQLRMLPGVPEYVAGVFCYRGAIVPVLDLSRLLSNVPAAKRFSTRLVLVRYPAAAGGERVLGLLVEHATQELAENLGGFVSSGISTPDAPFLGKIAMQKGTTIQLLSIQELVPEALRARLFVED